MTPSSGLLLLVSLALFTCHSAGENDPAVLNSVDDYDYYPYTDSPDEPKNSSSRVLPCNYDLCENQKIPCVNLSVSTGCLCPGVSGPNETPDAPVLLDVTKEGSQVVVHWCSPPSAVTHYQILVGRHHLLTASQLTRRVLLPELDPGTTVCVEAVNRAGSSRPTKTSCRRYELANSPSMAAWVIGGVLAFVLLLLLALVVFLLRRNKAGSRSRAGNPSDRGEVVF
ncbi:LRRN4 C-terminal-like protein [Paramormyrops kingsleyae]|uniref:LRRN4 C-terminal-like protein n=1 Tax=Paramormyrops kingsleyae TaxID=1676925 RepID=A0A3B3RTS4_9TELE|nr:LRRN4 C-terminal-like protein [Paramormyrops kingsleyae]